MRKTSFLLLAIFAYIPFVSAQRWHVKPTPEEIVYRQQHPKPLPASTQKTTAGTFVMPTDARFPGEFEESQAVALAWIYDIGGIDISSEYADLWAAMANAIQQECQVWIRVENGADTTAVKNFMSSNGTPLTNYRFFVTVSDDFWIRDFGPLGFYYGSNDDVGFLNMNYYPGRDYDNLFPGYLANELGYLEVKTNLYAEGGNYITDGFHRSFHSDVIQSVNTSGPPYTPAHAAWTTQQVNDSIKYVWASTDVITTPTLKCDGGTGHNDMFMKLMDENTFAVMEYPSIVTAADKGIIDGVINTLSTKTSVYGQPYRIFKVPMPTRDDGNITTLCNLLDNDARTFVNGLTVNGSYLMPTYSDAASGNKAGDQVAINLFKQIAPGYKIIPLDARILTIYGGAVHCVTMQIPAENPITIWHPPVLDKQPQVNKFHIVAKATNKSGIASTKCMWRIRGNQNWNTLTLTDSSGYSIGDITDNFTQMSKQTVIEYYITSTSNNGKTITKPITAGNGGYYKFYFEVPDGIAELDEARNFALNPFPNPTIGNFVIPVSFDGTRNVQAIITDVMGKRITELDFGSKSNGMSKLEFDISDKAAGMYFIQITADGKLLTTKRVMKQ
ncbi:MAG: agmatine deiminase family protein [Chitinophagaceae bacterium]|nr:agmatine deiminase family protein [Chitinophagaceae bacterium]